MKKNQKKFALFTALALFAAFIITAILLPSRDVLATENKQGEVKDCLVCHDQVAKLWKGSRHNTGNVNCLVCHKLAQSGGKHPEEAKYTVESEGDTCLVCHTNVAGENIAGQLALSKHGKVGLTCVSCHEQHSQGLKLADGSRTVCENCHKKEMKTMLASTHFKAGLSCVNCHMGKQKSHTLIVAVQTCSDCHKNLHEANRMIGAGLEIKAMTTPSAMVAVTPKPTAEVAPTPASGGVNMPSWTLVFAGMIIGGIVSWALLGKEPGKPSDE